MVSNRKKSGIQPKNKRFGCELCRVSASSEATLRQHLEGKRHAMQLKKQYRRKQQVATQIGQIEETKRGTQSQQTQETKLNENVPQNSALLKEKEILTVGVEHLNKDRCDVVTVGISKVKHDTVPQVKLMENGLSKCEKFRSVLDEQNNASQGDRVSNDLIGFRIMDLPMDFDKEIFLDCLYGKIEVCRIIEQQRHGLKKKDVQIRNDERGQYANIRIKNIVVVDKIVELGTSEGFFINEVRLNIEPWYGKKKQKKNDNLIQVEGAAMETLTLSNCQSVSEQMSTLWHIQQTNADVQTRKEIVCTIYEIFYAFFPGCDITEIGISALGFSTKDYVLDLNLNLGDYPTPLDHKCSLPMPNVPNYIEIKFKNRVHGKPNVTKESLVYLAQEERIIVLYKILREQMSYTVTEEVSVIKFERAGVSCRLHLNNREAVKFTNVLSVFKQIDDRVSPLIFTLLYWAEHGKKDAFVHVPVSKYSWIMLVVFYLQNTRPPILPPVIPFNQKKKHADDWEKYHRHYQQKHKVFAKNNKQDLESLLKGFCKYYCDFDFSLKVVCASTGHTMRSSKMPLEDSSDDVVTISQMNIQDPFSGQNTCRNIVNEIDPVRLKQNLSKITSLLDDNVQSSLNTEQPRGLASLLEDIPSPKTSRHKDPSLPVQKMTSPNQAPNVPPSTSQQATKPEYHISSKYFFPVFMANQSQRCVENEDVLKQWRASACSRVLGILKEIFYFDIEVKSDDLQMLNLLETRVKERHIIGNENESSGSDDESNDIFKALDSESPGNILVRIIGTFDDEIGQSDTCKQDITTDGNTTMHHGENEDMKPDMPCNKSEDASPELPIRNTSDDVKSGLPCNENEDVKPGLLGKEIEAVKPEWNDKNVAEPGSLSNRYQESGILPSKGENGLLGTHDIQEINIDEIDSSTQDDKTNCPGANISSEIPSSSILIDGEDSLKIELGDTQTTSLPINQSDLITKANACTDDTKPPCKKSKLDDDDDSLNERRNTQTTSLPINHGDVISTANESTNDTKPPCKKSRVDPYLDKAALVSLKCCTRYSLWNGRNKARRILKKVIKERGLTHFIDDHAFTDFQMEKAISDNIIKNRPHLTHMDTEISFVLGIYIPQHNPACMDFNFSQMENMDEFRRFYKLFKKFITHKLYKYCEIKKDLLGSILRKRQYDYASEID